METIQSLFSGIFEFHWQFLIMYAIGGVLIYLAIAKDYEPMLLLPIGFGAILSNLPLNAVWNMDGGPGVLKIFYEAGILTDLFPGADFHRDRCDDGFPADLFHPEDGVFRGGGPVGDLRHHSRRARPCEADPRPGEQYYRHGASAGYVRQRNAVGDPRQIGGVHRHSSARRTGRPPSSWQESSRRISWDPSPWRRIPIWRSFRSSSHPSSGR